MTIYASRAMLLTNRMICDTLPNIFCIKEIYNVCYNVCNEIAIINTTRLEKVRLSKVAWSGCCAKVISYFVTRHVNHLLKKQIIFICFF